MKIPVVLSTVRVDTGDDEVVRVDVDGEPHHVDRTFVRSDLRTVLDQITTELGTAVRVEIREADGTMYADIATPPEPGRPELPRPEPAAGSPVAALAGTGFRPGEEVALAYVVARQSADAVGNASINLPPAILAATREGLVLLGLASGAVVPIGTAR